MNQPTQQLHLEVAVVPFVVPFCRCAASRSCSGVRLSGCTGRPDGISRSSAPLRSARSIVAWAALVAALEGP